MKKTILKRWAVVCLCIAALHSLSGCGDDVELNIPQTNFYYETNAEYLTYVKKGDILLFNLFLNAKESSNGVTLKKIVYSIDGKEVNTALDEKHTFSQTMTELGEHTLEAKYECGGKGFTDVTGSISFPFTVVEEIPVIDFTLDIQTKDVPEGVAFICTVREYEENTLDIVVTKVTYSIDGEELATLNTPPFAFSCPKTRVGQGTKTLKVSATFTREWKGTISRTFPIEAFSPKVEAKHPVSVSILRRLMDNVQPLHFPLQEQ